ncbi:pleckstrin homology domain-containing family G member 1 [Chanos chanos]|uniref:Pleckstrin homology domain-containing family G member 1 n=1 Tax=Chanos chanos TaxID=29144 RepID=A0A6J2W9P9_CHACN|nr:pleckstrin homology domain-containing family G member 1-like [Chanos chanos]
MDSAHCNDRPISYGSTSSSASSRDSHCSLGSRTVLGPALERDRDAGAIRLELVPARQLEEEEEEKAGRQTPKQTRRADINADGTQAGEGRKVQYVDRVVQEILETEKTYVEDLKSIVQDYLDCISNQSRLLLEAEERNSLFGNIRDIYRFNSDLLNDLEKCNADPVAIAKCFVAKSEEFHIYTQYCTNYPRSVAVLTECMKNKAVAKFLRERQESLKHSLPLGSYLLKPVQRILKYHLLLHEIATHLEKDSEMHGVVKEAIDTMQRVAWHINDMKRKHEHAVRLQEIQSLLTNWKGPDLIGYGELVLEGTFRIQRAKNERTLFLLDKVLLITKKREETYTYKAHILCCNLMLVEVIPKEPLSFSVFHYKNPKLQHTVQAKSQQEKRTWILHLKRLILENHPAKIPAKAKQAILEMDAIHHPGFHYTPEGEKRSSSHTKEGPSPRRVRRKTEPLSKLLKNPKHSVSSPDTQKRSSLGATLLSPMVHLGSIGRSRSLVNQSQESLDPSDHGDPSDVEDSEGLHQQDADDEDDSGLGSRGKLRVPGKSSRKRLNPQVSVDSIDQWRNHSLSHADLQTAKESLQMDTAHAPILQVTSPSESQADDHIIRILVPGSEHSVPNIWADHRVRNAMFPTRQQTVQIDDEEDIYQMFVPSENELNRQEPDSDHDSSPGRPGRPCSWHVEQTQTVQLDLPASQSRVLRRASSVGEKQTDQQNPATRANHDPEESSHQTESSSNDISGSSSAEQLTIDDIENVYDNISYEELQAMGLIRRDQEVSHRSSGTTEVKHGPDTPVLVVPPSETESSSESNRSSGQEGALFGTCDLQIVEEEENIYDTFFFLKPTQPTKKMVRQNSMHVPEPDPEGDESLGGSASEESLRMKEERKDEQSPLYASNTSGIETDYSSSSTSETVSQHITTDHTSQQVEEIWNDLENYIRNNEKKQDRLPAAFPVSGQDSFGVHDSPKKSHESPRKARDSPRKKINSPHKTQDSPCKQKGVPKVSNPPVLTSSPTPNPPPQSLSIPVIKVAEPVQEDKDLNLSPTATPSQPLPPTPVPQPGTVKSIRNKLARLSSGSFRMDDEDLPPQRDAELQALLSGLDAPLLPLASSSLLLGGEAGDQVLELGEKGKNRVFLMARQYSQKIKKANQLLKMKSMDQEPTCARLRTARQKDLAAILEEKKQGGAAIGARIAEYSHLYEQVMFKEPPVTAEMQKTFSSMAGPHAHSSRPLSGLTSSPSLPDRTTLEEDWLNCTYSNGELADFVSWPSEGEGRASTPQRRLNPASSVPALKNLPPPPITPPSQRWSTCVTPASKDDSTHIYSSLGCNSSSNVPPYSRCQSSSSLALQPEKENSVGVSNRGWEGQRGSGVPTQTGRGLGPRQHSLPERPNQLTSDLSVNSDLTLRDSQQVVVLNKKMPLSAHSATQNYLANFKDNGDNDDDYVEIRSEDESEREAVVSTHARSLPCTPSSVNPVTSFNALSDCGHLNEYQWKEPEGSQQGLGQPNIVQSLREKFQCLSSSSFA